MKRLARIISFAAGIGALVWAMRDRFISLALPREPQPPAFRHPDDHPNVSHRPRADLQPAPAQAPDDLEQIKGIGPVFAKKLAEMGITSVAGLSEASTEAIASKLDIGEARVVPWIEQARALAAGD